MIFIFNLLVILIVQPIIWESELLAIPAFARKYKTSCTTCHIAFSKRNSFGETFRRNGYIFPTDDLKMIKERPVKLGTEEWKELWPNAIWPGFLPEYFPMAAVSIMRVNYDLRKDTKGESRIVFNMPAMFNFVWGGAFGEDVAFFGEWAAYSFGQNATGLNRLFLQFNSVVGRENLFNIRVGRFEPGITDGYSATQRLTSSYPITMDYSPANLPSGQPSWRARDPQSGIELNGIVNHNYYYAIGLVNGESKTIGDPTDQKDFYARFAFQFGGFGFDGKDFDSLSIDQYEDKFLSLGIYSYWGSRNKLVSKGILYNNSFNRIGLDCSLHFPNLELLGGIILGKDENPDNDLRTLTSTAYFVEGTYNFYPWLIGLLRIERANWWKQSDYKGGFVNIIPHLTILYRANVRFTIEGLIKLYDSINTSVVTVDSDYDNPPRAVSLNAVVAF